MAKSAALVKANPHISWMTQIVTRAKSTILDNPESTLGGSGKSVRWHDINERQIEERDSYNELLRRLSINTSARDDLLFLFLQIFCAENQDFNLTELAPRVDAAFALWVEDAVKSKETLLMGDSCACIRLARLERKLSHVLCLLTLIIKSTVDSEMESLCRDVIMRSFVAMEDHDDEFCGAPPLTKMLDSLLQLLLALWSQISAVKLQITTQYNYMRQKPPPLKTVPDLNMNTSEALRLIVTKLPPN